MSQRDSEAGQRPVDGDGVATLPCPVARTLAVVGAPGAFLIVRDLLLHPSRRFQDFAAAQPGMSPNTLSARLKKLQAEGVLETRRYSDHPPRFEYVLTDKGRALGPVIRAMREWGSRFTE